MTSPARAPALPRSASTRQPASAWMVTAATAGVEAIQPGGEHGSADTAQDVAGPTGGEGHSLMPVDVDATVRAATTVSAP